MKILNNTIVDCLLRNLDSSGRKRTDALKRLSSGLRIERAKDDPSGLAASNVMRVRADSMFVAARNCSETLNLLQNANGGLDTIRSASVRLSQLAVAGGNGSHSATERQTIQNEFRQVAAQIQMISASTKWGSIHLLDGTCNINIQTSPEAGNNTNITIDKVTTTSLGTVGTGTIGVNLVHADGATIGAAQSGATFSDVKNTVFADQVVTIRNAGETRELEFSDLQGNKSLSDFAAAVTGLNMDGIRGSKAVTDAILTDLTKAAVKGSEGDYLQFELNIGGGISQPVGFLIGQDSATTTANLFEALESAISAFNDPGITISGYGISSDTGRNIAIGNLKYQDNAAIKIGNFGNTPIGTPISFVLTPPGPSDGTVVFAKGSTAAQDMANLHDALNSHSPPLSNWHYDFRTNPADQTVVIKRSDTANIGAGTDFGVDDFKNIATQATVDNFSNYSGEQITLTVDGTNVSFTAAGSNQTQNAINLHSSLVAKGFTAARSGGLVTITKNTEAPIAITNYTDQPNRATLRGFVNTSGDTVSLDVDGTLVSFTAAGSGSQALNAQRLKTALDAAGFTTAFTSDSLGVDIIKADKAAIQIADVSNYAGQANTAVISNFTNVAGETVSLDINGVPVSFIAAGSADQAGNAHRMKQVLDAAGFTTSYTPGDTGVRITKSDNSTIQVRDITDYSGRTNAAEIRNFVNVEGESIALKVNNIDVSFTAAGADQAENARRFKEALDNAGFATEYSADGTGVRISTGSGTDIAISNYSGNDLAGSGFDIVAEAGSIGSSAILEGGAVDATVSDVRSRLEVQADSGSTGSNTLEERGNTVATISDIRNSIYVSVAPGSNGNQTIREGGTLSTMVTDLTTGLRVTSGIGSTGTASIIETGPTGTSISASKATATVWSLEDKTELNGSTSPVLLSESGTNSFNAVHVDDGARSIGLMGRHGLAVEIDTGDTNWSIVTGHIDIEFDPNMEFRFSSNVDGTGQEGGLFYARANDAAAMDYLTRQVSSPSFMSISQVDLTTYDGILTGIGVLEGALESLNEIQGHVGAQENQMEFTLNSLNSMRENLQSSNSCIKDADIAQEVIELTRASMLKNIATSLLAQVNKTITPSIVSLLKQFSKS